MVLDWAKKNNVPVVYSSSSSVIGNGDGPASPYALSKYVGEMETLLYNKLYGLKTVALRYFNVYSYDQEANSEYATVVCNWKKFITERKVPYITGDGEQRRDMTHVDDIVSANIFCAESIDKDDLWGHWYDIGSGQNISLNELKEIVLQYFPEQGFEYVDPRPGDVMFTEADLDKFKAHGWESRVPLQEGLNSVYRKLKEELDK
jgi:nucleoside-diphosphate-sugar epimerase